MVRAAMLIAQLYVGVIWCLAAGGKVVGQAPELAIVRRLPGERMGRRTMVTGAAGVELVLGLFFIGGRFFPLVPLASATLLMAFMVLRLKGTVSGNCGCFGSLQRDRSLQLRQLSLWAALSSALALASRFVAPATLPLPFFAALIGVLLSLIVLTRLYRRHRELDQIAAFRQLGASLSAAQAASARQVEESAAVHRTPERSAAPAASAAESVTL